MSFPCDKCGACCRVKQCKHLTIDSLCAVHDELPDDCSIDAMYRSTGADREVTEEQWYDEMRVLCGFLQMREAHRRSV